MQERAAVLEHLAGDLDRALADPVGRRWHATLGLRCEPGGQVGSPARVPWVRIYNLEQSPSAQEGIYLAYLFAADGSRAYLSLMHGSSEFRSGGMRAMADRDFLVTSAAVARSALGDLAEAGVAADALVTIDLAWRGFSHPERPKAYESANILAIGYRARRIPSDTELLADLAGMLPLLARLYGADLAPRPYAGDARGPVALPGRAQGRTSNPDIRTAIELFAENRAVAFFEEREWEVKRVGQYKRGYDLECTKPNGAVLHVEVKGTSRLGEKVVLTGNEVAHARSRCPAEHILYVVSRITVTEGDSIRCSGDTATETRLWPWTIHDRDLIATEYWYTVAAIEDSPGRNQTFCAPVGPLRAPCGSAHSIGDMEANDGSNAHAESCRARTVAGLIRAASDSGAGQSNRGRSKLSRCATRAR